MTRHPLLLVLSLVMAGCQCGKPGVPGGDGGTDAGQSGADAGVGDGGQTFDAGAAKDGGGADGGSAKDGGGADAGVSDSGTRDAGASVDSGCSTIGIITDVLTYHNDLARTGQYLTEACLTPASVNPSKFGKLFVLAVDGKVDAQPLYKSNVSVPGKGVHNVLFVATEHGTVYAFDADTAPTVGAPNLWKVSMLGSGETPSDNRGCDQVTPEIGVTATPVIDPATNTIYVVAMSKNANAYFQRLHALDLRTGVEKTGSPVLITAKYPGTGAGSSGGFVVFDPGQYKERPGLLLLNGQVYLAWSSHCDFDPYTGFITAYDATSLQQTAVIDVSPNGKVSDPGHGEASIWMSGAGMAADNSGSIYFLTGNGTFDTTLNAQGFPNLGDFGNAFVKLSTAGSTLTVSDYFTMSNTVGESGGDTDLGSGGEMLLPDSVGSSAHRHLIVGAGKDTNIYLVDRDNMGHFDPNQNNIVQELTGVLPGGVWAIPAYYNGAIYYGPQGHSLRRFGISNAVITAAPTSITSTSFGYPGTFPSISSDGPASANGIVWAVEGAQNNPSVLHAYKASDLTQELYNSTQAAGGRDAFGAGNKFIVPTIANGKVYVGTTNGVGVFGLR